MLIVAGLYAAGVLLGEFCPQPVGWLILGGLVAGTVFFVVDWLETRCDAAINSPGYFAFDGFSFTSGIAAVVRPVMLSILIIMVGWANFALQTSPISPADIRHHAPPSGIIANVQGTLTAAPAVRAGGLAERYLIQLELEAAQFANDWLAVRGCIVISTTNQMASNLFAGQRIEMDGVLLEPERAPAPGFFNYRNKLGRGGIWRELRTDEFSQLKVLPQTNPPSRPIAEGWRKWARQNLSRGMGEPDEAMELLWAMSLGWRTGLTGEVAAPFMRSGTMHLFAISGLHIALVAGILVSLLRVMRLPKHWAAGVAIPLLWFYTAATGWQPSAIRASVMTTLILGTWVFRRPVNVLNSLGAAAFLILLWDPQQLFGASFQLSFTVVFSLAIVLPHVTNWLEAIIRPDPLLPRELWSWQRRGMLTAGYWLIGGLAVSISAWLASAPLIAHYFNLFSPVALLINVPVVVCGAFALASCLGSLFFGPWLEPVTILFNHAAWFFMRCMMTLSQWAADLPNAWQFVRAPAPWLMAGWYIALFGLGTGWLLHRAVRRWAMGAGIAFVGIILWQWQADRERVHVTFLPNSPVILVEDRDVMLVDCGSERSVEFLLPRQLQQRGIDSLSQLVLTHGVKHHVGGFEKLMDAQPIEAVYISHARSNSKFHRAVMASLDESPSLKKIVSAGDHIGPWTVLHPAKTDDFLRSTDDALVLHGTFHGVRLLLLSDVGSNGQQALLARDADLRADILVLSVPDESPPAVSRGLLREVAPKMIVLHDARFPVLERAPDPFVKSLEASGAKVISVGRLGGLRLVIDRSGWRVVSVAGKITRH